MIDHTHYGVWFSQIFAVHANMSLYLFLTRFWGSLLAVADMPGFLRYNRYGNTQTQEVYISTLKGRWPSKGSGLQLLH